LPKTKREESKKKKKRVLRTINSLKTEPAVTKSQQERLRRHCFRFLEHTYKEKGGQKSQFGFEWLLPGAKGR